MRKGSSTYCFCSLIRTDRGPSATWHLMQPHGRLARGRARAPPRPCGTGVALPPHWQAGCQSPWTFAGCHCILALTDSEGSAHSNWSYSCIIFSFSPALLPVYFLLSEEEEMLEPGTRYLLERSISPIHLDRSCLWYWLLEWGPPCLLPVGPFCYPPPDHS